jgi:hypothetical protein
MSHADDQKPAPGELFLDHVAHFVPDIDAAAALLERLGFVVTPLSVQEVDGRPAGASNRCVMLEQGYIEVLTPTHDTPTARSVRAAMERFTGVHLATFGTPDAQAEHARLAAHGFEPQPLVDLERRLDDGNTVRFKVVRTAPGKMAEGRIQYVQHLAPEAIWTPRNLAHSNGVTGLSAVYVCAAEVAATAARWARFSALLPHAAPRWAELVASRGSVVIAGAAALHKEGGFDTLPAAPALAGYSLRCREPAQFAERCAKAGLPVRRRQRHFSVGLPALLGGTWILYG